MPVILFQKGREEKKRKEERFKVRLPQPRTTFLFYFFSFFPPPPLHLYLSPPPHHTLPPPPTPSPPSALRTRPAHRIRSSARSRFKRLRIVGRFAFFFSSSKAGLFGVRAETAAFRRKGGGKRKFAALSLVRPAEHSKNPHSTLPPSPTPPHPTPAPLSSLLSRFFFPGNFLLCPAPYPRRSIFFLHYFCTLSLSLLETALRPSRRPHIYIRAGFFFCVLTKEKEKRKSCEPRTLAIPPTLP